MTATLSVRISFSLIFFCLLGFCAASFGFFYWAGIDDNFITMWSGETLGRDWWFINYNGERAEMGSSILAALLAKVAFWISPAASYLINKILLFVCAPAALCMLWRYRATYLFGKNANVIALATVVTAACMPHLQCWAQSGMEAPLHTLVLTWYAFVLIRYAQSGTLPWMLIAAQCLLILVRAEGFWAIAATFALLLLVHGWGVFSRKRLAVYLVPACFFAVLLGARYAATGLLFPNPAYAKITFSMAAIMRGLWQLKDFYALNMAQKSVALGLIAAVALCGVYKIQRLRRGSLSGEQIALLGLMTVIFAHEAFFMLAGGGFGAPLHRLLVPTTLLKCAVLFHLLARYGGWFSSKAMALAIAGLLSYSYVNTAARVTQHISDPFLYNDIQQAQLYAKNELAWPDSLEQANTEMMMLNRANGRDMREVYPFIEEGLGQQLLRARALRIVTYQAGLFPYMIKRLYPDAPITFFDPAGLMDAKVGLAAARSTNGGVAGFVEYGSLLAGKRDISSLALAFNPNMLYAERPVRSDAQRLPEMGWEIVHQQPNAVIWMKPANNGKNNR